MSIDENTTTPENNTQENEEELKEETPQPPRTADGVIHFKIYKKDEESLEIEYSSFDRENNHQRAPFHYHVGAMEALFHMIVQDVKKMDNPQRRTIVEALASHMVLLNGTLIELAEEDKLIKDVLINKSNLIH